MNIEGLKLLGWEYSIYLESGLESAYEWFVDHQHQFRAK
jgi:GDP-L-fucose synthase